MDATAKNGDVWIGEESEGYWIYRDSQGRLYDSREVPAFRIHMDNAQIVTTADGKRAIAPI